MCTAISYTAIGHYFGRTLDHHHSFGEQVVITPRKFPLPFRCMPRMEHHHTMIGVAVVAENYPLYFDATNEMGLSMAGLNFPISAHYQATAPHRDNIAPYEFIPWVLGQCANLREAHTLLNNINLTNLPFSEQFPLSPLHWLIADRSGAVTVEQTKDGLKIFDNPVGVLTNEPPFDCQMHYLTNFMGLSRENAQNRLCPEIPLTHYSLGMGAMGLPGDLSSTSRFVRACFTKLNSVCVGGKEEEISQFFHILGSVEQQRGCVHLGNGQYEITQYTSCCDTDRGLYCYTTYDNCRITCVDLHGVDLEERKLFSYPLLTKADFFRQN